MDSTVIAEEGIDILADFCGAAEAVADLTSRYSCNQPCLDLDWLPFFSRLRCERSPYTRMYKRLRPLSR